MSESTRTQSGAQGGAGAPPSGPGGLRCDFCGALVPSVRRIALDRGYERLRTRHVEQYACPPCSEKKERSRLGLGR